MSVDRRKRGAEVFDVDIDGEQLVVLSLPLDTLETPSVLSPVQREVAAMAASGLSNTEIAERRGRSERTVANQLAQIYRKLGIGSRAELALRLRQR